MSFLTVKPRAVPHLSPNGNASTPIPSQMRAQRDANDLFCYHCRKDGHISAHCSAPQNYPKVILIQVQRKLKVNQKETSTPKEANYENVNVKRSVVSGHTNNLPEGLIGPPSTPAMKVVGTPCTALLDSGSQVTIIFDSWYDKPLTHVRLQPATGLAICN